MGTVIYILISVSKHCKLPLAAKTMGARYLLVPFCLAELRQMTAAKGPLSAAAGFPVWAGSSSRPPCSSLGDVPAGSQLHCTAHPWVGENEPFQPQKHSRRLGAPLSAGCECHRLTQQLSSVAPMMFHLQEDPAKSWCSLQQLHTAVSQALAVFVIYRTTKQGGGWTKFCKCSM